MGTKSSHENDQKPKVNPVHEMVKEVLEGVDLGKGPGDAERTHTEKQWMRLGLCDMGHKWMEFEPKTAREDLARVLQNHREIAFPDGKKVEEVKTRRGLPFNPREFLG